MLVFFSVVFLKQINIPDNDILATVNFELGIGNDPREDRKFNMIKQSMDYDPDGNFIGQWVPELKNLPGNKRHSPWILSTGMLSSARISLGEDYPNPVVVAPEWSRHQKGKVRSIISDFSLFAHFFSLSMFILIFYLNQLDFWLICG